VFTVSSFFSDSTCIPTFVKSLFLLQIKDEVKAVLDFINYVYEIFGFKYELELSTVFFYSFYLLY
jgi:hypothetical protein